MYPFALHPPKEPTKQCYIEDRGPRLYKRLKNRRAAAGILLDCLFFNASRRRDHRPERSHDHRAHRRGFDLPCPGPAEGQWTGWVGGLGLWMGWTTLLARSYRDLDMELEVETLKSEPGRDLYVI